ncbi:hypothetical protein GCM10023208_15710 [Erythrobacter westpacificensis]|uniref:Recombinase family protein n=1 Tax=Erythrobacter westpacificensis TaxID=1055231 RepID=A0ABP9K8J9_9SPHN
MKPVRCAIYTRKSSEEGLEQGFNSLDAQREACAAYIKSQASEGWELLETPYDDGGISGGTLERPGLKALLADVAAGKVDIIVVYKVDRLTRSLLDFAKLVEALDKAGTSFVSITQAFNTTTSMGRLTLNMLLSFAQFEREVTAERIRDKIAASKAKGMWMGGIPPLGYRPDERSLAIVENHANLVRNIYARYLELGNVRALAKGLAAEGTIVPRRKTRKGKPLGGGAFTRGQLYAILGNPIYAGDIQHNGTLYPGLHPPIIERALWDKVQQHLAANRQGVRGKPRGRKSFLKGLICDEAGEPLVAAHTTKGKTRYRYYVSRRRHFGEDSEGDKGLRIPAPEAEQAVSDALGDLFADPVALADKAGITLSPTDLEPLAARCTAAAKELQTDGGKLIALMVSEVTVLPSGLAITIRVPALTCYLQLPGNPDPAAVLCLKTSARVTRTGRAVRLVQDNGAHLKPDGPDKALIRLVAKARSWWAIIAQGVLDPTALARKEGVTVSYVTRVVRLAFLSPEIVEAIMAGGLKAGIDGSELMRAGTIDPDWEQQAEQLLAR